MEDVVSKQYRYTVIFEPLPEGGFDVVFPAIPEICTFGQTLEEARDMAVDALSCYLQSALKNGETPPENLKQQPVKEEVAVTV